MIRPSRFVCPAVALMTVVFGACARRGAAPVTSASPATPVPAAPAPASPVAARPVTVVPNPNAPKVLVIATGGTIAGVQNAPGTLGGYRAGTLTAEQITASVPELARYARVETEQFSNVASTMVTPEMWVKLAKRINAVLQRGDLAGVVVTHGTDRLEETAFFLYLTVRSSKPVVVVGSQRPATGISPDGPINLLSAVRTAASPKATQKGVMVVMDDRILSARESRKLYQRTGGFSTGDMGMLGVVASQGPEFFFAPVRRFGERSEFDLDGVDTLPKVELTMSYPGGTGQTFTTNPKGVVVATTGMTTAENATYRALRQTGVVVVTSFTSGENANGGGGGGDGPSAPARTDSTARPDSVARPSAPPAPPVPPAVVAQHLTATKARILLMVALTRTQDPREIQRIFNEY
ncbi:asparaginase [Gemmatimonas sp.]|uniref:asparaginase n=1 Tax=Gemmatimonas sp. TaxID=1962908 RepID=UPI0025BE63CC|nr:asparaginase [Gemmatimonas sp.]MCA2991911.1 asparaginase [Gemmatimonas sp.]